MLKHLCDLSLIILFLAIFVYLILQIPCLFSSMFKDQYSNDFYFDYSVKAILKHEGGLTNDKDDPGGITNWGISLRFLKLEGLDPNENGVIDQHDVTDLSEEEAIKIYKKYWWDQYQYQRFSSLIVVSKVFDLAVNMGANASHKILQKSLNQIRDEQIPVDGVLGAQTINASNEVDEYMLLYKLRENAKLKYLDILNKNPKMEWARIGWLKRAEW